MKVIYDIIMPEIFFGEICVAQSLVFCVVFCISLTSYPFSVKFTVILYLSNVYYITAKKMTSIIHYIPAME